MTTGTNGTAYFRREDQTPEEWAQIAANHALDAHQAVGALTGEVSKLTLEVQSMRRDMIQGFADLGVRVRKTRVELVSLTDEIKDEIEDTKVRDLRKLVSSHQKRWKIVVGVLVSVVTALVSGGLAKAFLGH